MTFRERFQRAAVLARVEWSPTEIGRALGKSKQTVARWMDSSTPPAEEIFHIADKWKVDARWLATGEGSMIPRVAMQPSAPEYRAFSEDALQLARQFDQLQHPPLRDHIQTQIKFLLDAQRAPAASDALDHEVTRVRLDKTTKGKNETGIKKARQRK